MASTEKLKKKKKRKDPKRVKAGKMARSKGGRVERELAEVLISLGVTDAHRTKQLNGEGDSDVISKKVLPSFHLECKGAQQLNLHKEMYVAVGQATKEQKIPVICHKKNHTSFLVTMPVDVFVQLAKTYEKHYNGEVNETVPAHGSDYDTGRRETGSCPEVERTKVRAGRGNGGNRTPDTGAKLRVFEEYEKRMSQCD